MVKHHMSSRATLVSSSAIKISNFLACLWLPHKYSSQHTHTHTHTRQGLVASPLTHTADHFLQSKCSWSLVEQQW